MNTKLNKLTLTEIFTAIEQDWAQDCELSQQLRENKEFEGAMVFIEPTSKARKYTTFQDLKFTLTQKQAGQKFLS